MSATSRSDEAAVKDPLAWLHKDTTALVEPVGHVVRASGTTIHVAGIVAAIGQRCSIARPDGSHALQAEVVGIEHDRLILFPFGPLQGITSDSVVRTLDQQRQVGFSIDMQGQILDAFGQPTGDSEAVLPTHFRSLDAGAPNPLSRQPINTILVTGIKVIDSLLTVGVGQRLGIFAMAGAGKSTLLAMLARHAAADVIVIGLIGERGREVREFIEQALGPAGMRRSVIVMATSDRPAMERVIAAQTATAIAEGYRAAGHRVLLLMDSVTRYARALREVGLSSGELPVSRGYPPSVFAELPRLFERTGNDDRGSITAFYTVLTEEEGAGDPVADEARAILDGHLMLSRKLGEAGQFPAIDVPSSVSRLANTLAGGDMTNAAAELRRLITKYRDIEFLLQIGEYEKGSDPLADRAISLQEPIRKFLVQRPDVSVSIEETIATLSRLTGKEVGLPATGLSTGEAFND